MSNKYDGLMKTLDSLLSLVDDAAMIEELAEDILQLDERLMAVEYALGLHQPQSNSVAPVNTNSLADFIAMIQTGDFVVLDTETTGLHDGEIVEIAIIDNTGLVWLNKRVKPENPIPPEATAIHGITDDDVKDELTWAAITKDVEKILEGRNVVVYNAVYDRKMMHQSAEKAGLPKTDWKAISTWWCAMTLFAEVYGNWNDYHGSYRWQKLATAANYYKVPVRDEHSALGDCLMTLEIVKAMAATLAVKNGATQS